MQAMLRQAQNLQKDMLKTKDEIDKTEFTGENGFVKVGAFIVGSVQVNYPLQVIQRSGKKVEHETFETSNAYQKGQEIGLFEFGSTVIVLFEKDKFAFKKGLNIGQSIKMGELIGSSLSPSMH